MNIAVIPAAHNSTSQMIKNFKFPNKLHYFPGQQRRKAHYHGVEIIHLSDADKRNILRAASRVSGDPYKNLDDFRANARKALDPVINQILGQKVEDMAKHKGKNVAYLIKNNPISRGFLPGTPDYGTGSPKEKQALQDFISEAIMLWYVDRHGGKIISDGDDAVEDKEKFTQTMDGKSKDQLKAGQYHKIEQIIPNGPGKGINKVPTYFDIPKFMHVEEAHDPNLPDTLMLFTLRGDKNAKSAVVSVDKIINEIEPKVVEALKKPNFIIFPEEGEGGKSMITSILSKNEHGQNTIRFHSDPKYCRGINQEANDALTILRAYLSDHRNVPRIALEKGDLLLSDNTRALHGTYPYKNSSDKKEDYRWLQRLYIIVRKALEAIHAQQKEEPLLKDKADNNMMPQ